MATTQLPEALVPSLEPSDANSHYPTLSTEQWKSAAATYKELTALGGLEPCDAFDFYSAFYRVAPPPETARDQGLAFLDAMDSLMRLFARSAAGLDPKDAAAMDHGLDLAERHLAEPFPQSAKDFLGMYIDGGAADAEQGLEKALFSCQTGAPL